MGKIGQQQQHYKPLLGPRGEKHMDHFLTRPQSITSISPMDPFATMDPLLGLEEVDNHTVTTHLLSSLPRGAHSSYFRR